MEQQQRDDRSRQAARGEASQHQPVDRSARPVHPAAEPFGDRCEKEIGAYRRLRSDAEEEHQQRRHQRAAADARESDEHADQKAGEGVQQIHGVARSLMERNCRFGARKLEPVKQVRERRRFAASR